VRLIGPKNTVNVLYAASNRKNFAFYSRIYSVNNILTMSLSRSVEKWHSFMCQPSLDCCEINQSVNWTERKCGCCTTKLMSVVVRTESENKDNLSLSTISFSHGRPHGG